MSLTRYDPPPGVPLAPGSMLILPGGGYARLAPHEGEGYARYFSGHGLVCHVLAYPLGGDGHRHPAMLDAAAHALRTLRATARAEGRAVDRISIIGSSAGGHLASTLLTRFDAGNPSSADPIARESSRPDLGLLCYPVIAMDASGHLGSQRNLLGENPSPELIVSLSNDRQVTAATPPCFIWHTATDTTVPVNNALRFATALWEHHVECALHVFESGRHGLGIPAAEEPSAPWPRLALAWLHRHGHVSAPV